MDSNGGTAADQESISQTENRKTDVPVLVAEILSIFFWIIAVILALSVYYLWKVHPPGEQDLCNVQTLRLENKTHTEQDLVLASCHGLYKGVFTLTKILSIPFGGCSILAGLSAYMVGAGARTRNQLRMGTCFMRAGVFDVLGVVALWIPSTFLLSMSAAVSVAVAPITAAWISIYVGYFGMKVVNHTQHGHGSATDAAIDAGSYWSTTIYQGFMACWYTDMGLFLGSVSMLGLWFLCLVDLIRNVVTIFCWRPDYDTVGRGTEICRLFRFFRARIRRTRVAILSGRVAEHCCKAFAAVRGMYRKWRGMEPTAVEPNPEDSVHGEYQKL